MASLWTRGLSPQQMAAVLKDEKEEQIQYPDRHPQKHLAIDIRNELNERARLTKEKNR